MTETLIIGIGGGGTNIAHEMAKKLKCRMVSVNPHDHPELDPSIERILVGQKVCKGHAVFTPARGRRAAQESKDVLAALVSSNARVVLVAGLGGGTGTGATLELARIARERDVDVVCAVTLPFSFETERRDRATEAFRELSDDGFTVLREDNAEAQEVSENWNKGMTSLLETVNTNLTRKVGDHFRMPING